jgi:hypothetical protein
MVPDKPAAADAPPATDMLPSHYHAYYRGVYDYVNYLARRYYLSLTDNSLSSNPEDPIEAQRLRLANYAALQAMHGVGTSS